MVKGLLEVLEDGV